MSESAVTRQPLVCPSWCTHDIEMEADEDGTWHYARPVAVQLSRDTNGGSGIRPAVLELQLSFLEVPEPLPHDHGRPEVDVRGDDGSGCLVQLCLSVDDVEAVAGEMVKLARAAKVTR